MVQPSGLWPYHQKILNPKTLVMPYTAMIRSPRQNWASVSLAGQGVCLFPPHYLNQMQPNIALSNDIVSGAAQKIQGLDLHT